MRAGRRERDIFRAASRNYVRKMFWSQVVVGVIRLVVAGVEAEIRIECCCFVAPPLPDS